MNAAHDWTELREAMVVYRRNNKSLPIWWRDDDAIEPTPALDRLEKLAESIAMPVHIAVIPKHTTNALAQMAQSSAWLRPVVHGWQHKSHAPPEEKKSEFGQLRDGADDELELAFVRMQQLFGSEFVPLFVPPWNRMHDDYFPQLARYGYQGVSTFLPRVKRQPVPGLEQINTHIDPIAWRSTRDLVDPETLIHQTAELITGRAQGDIDDTEPLGFLTHHLVHTEAIWDFSERLMRELLDAGASPQPLAPLLETADEPT